MGFSDWLELRRVRRDAQDLLADAKSRLRRGRHRLSPSVHQEVSEAHAALKAVVRGPDRNVMEDGIERLYRLLDLHLAFARKSRVREYAESIGGAVFLALFLRAFVVEAFTIPSGSMIPTLQVGDDIFVAKAAYGLRVPLTERALFVWSRPSRGDVVVFSHPQDGQDIIKRVVALGGDTVMLRRGILYVNGAAVPTQAMDGPCTYRDFLEMDQKWEERACEARIEALGDRRYVTYTAPGAHQRDFGPVQVARGEVFMMGDHRDDSNDSRFFGTVPVGLIKGRALVVWWSRGGPDGVRWNRLGHPVHAAPGARVTEPPAP
ncbi:MAG TPA: signal peptidase I [Polyangia bacterium]|jgi:signal peptidase I